MQRFFTNILTSKVEATAAFYQRLLGMEPKFSADWFVNLADPGNANFEIGILKAGHEILPKGTGIAPAGVMLTFVVEDCDAVHQKAISAEAEIIEEPTDMPYGQRRMILKDPAGTYVDVSALIK